MKKINNSILIAFIMGLLSITCFCIGVQTPMIAKIVSQNKKIDSLESQLVELKAENRGLFGLLELKDQQIGHYTHVEVKHSFRVIKK